MPPSPASLPPPGSPDVLYVVDLSGYVFRAYHAITPLSNTKGEVTHATMGTVNMIQKVVNEKKPAMLAVAMDSPKPSFRKAIDDRYKATRPPAPDDLRHQMKRCREIALAYNIPVYEQDGIEADDLIACLCERATKENVKVVIVTADKDMMQLIHDGDQDIVMWDSMRDRVYGPKEVEEKFGVPPSKVREVLAFMGDTSDNIPGVPGVGPKTAADLVRKFGSVEGVYAHAAELGKGKVNESVRTHEADAKKSLELVTLKSDLDIAFDKQHLKYGGANDAKLIELFTELEFTRLLGIVKAGASASGVESGGGEGAPSRDPFLRMLNASKAPNAPSPSAPPPAEAPAERGTVVYETVLAIEPIAELVKEAKKRGRIAIALAVTSDEAMRADIIGVGLSAVPGRGIYVPLSHRYLGAPKMVAWDAVKELLLPIMRDASVAKIGHDVKRSIITVEEKGIAVAGSTFDPMVASYLFDPEGDHTLTAIAKREFNADAPKYDGDAKKNRDRAVPFDELEVERAATFIAPAAEIALAAAERMEPRLDREGLGPLMRVIEMPLLSVLCEMERTGVLVDTAQLLRASKEAEETLAALDAKAKKIVGHDFAIRSRDQLEEILFDELNLPVLKRTPKGGRSTDASVLEELANEHELPAVILDYREMDKLRGTYLEALPRAQNPKTGRIHTRFDQAVAATGRLSSNDPNLQNIPVRSELGKSIRKAFIAPKGSRLVSADYSQIELRVLAHLSDDPRLMEAFTSDIDVHTHTASVIFEVKPEDVTKEMRGRAKTINFGVIYGMGEPRLARSLGITRKEAGEFIAQYFRRYDGVRRFMNDTVENAKRGEAVRTLTGRRRFLPNLHSANRGLRFEAERIARNTPIQGTAADIIKLAMVAIGKERPSPGAKMILTVHDELVFEVPEKEVAAAQQSIVKGMENAMKLRVPLKVDVGDGETWAAAKS
jgi:DNA polymerase-1